MIREWVLKRLINGYTLFFKLNDEEYYLINDILVDIEEKEVILSMVNRKMIDRYLKINNYYAIDKETGLKLGFDDILKKLNRTDFLKKNCRKRNEAMRLVLKEEIANAESDELKNSLNKVLNRRLDL